MGTLEGTVEAWILKLPESSNLKLKVQSGETKLFSERKYKDYVISKLNKANSLYKSQMN